MPLDSFDKLPYYTFQSLIEEWREEIRKREEEEANQKSQHKAEMAKQKSQQNFKPPTMPRK